MLDEKDRNSQLITEMLDEVAPLATLAMLTNKPRHVSLQLVDAFGGRPALYVLWAQTVTFRSETITRDAMEYDQEDHGGVMNVKVPRWIL